MKPDRGLIAAWLTFAGAGAFGSLVAIRHDIPGEPLDVVIPLSVPSGLVLGWGAGVVAPWPMPTKGRARRSSAPGVIRAGVGLGCIAGTLIESVTYRPSSWAPGVGASILLNIGPRSAHRCRTASDAQRPPLNALTLRQGHPTAAPSAASAKAIARP